jgi:transposase
MVVIRKTARREHETPKKARYRALVEDAGWSGIAAANRIKVNPSTAAKWLHRDTDRRTGKDRPGRPRMISEEQLEAIDKWFTGKYEHRACIT